MKKVFLLSCLLLSALLTFAQETKKVAILEVVDREGKVSYANKLILRSNLAKAITNTPGYEAYDRTDMDAILGEQNFQRTGMVSNDQIRRLGEMTGAQYVLVAEAVVVDANTMYITAKLLDVVTARTEMTDNQMMGNSAKDIQRGCQLLAEKMIKPVVSVPYANHQPKTIKNKQANGDAAVANDAGYITKISNNEYRFSNGTMMDKKAYEDFIYKNCPEAWRKYQSGKRTIAAGWAFFSVGLALTSMWGLVAIESDYNRTIDDIQLTAIILGSTGAGMTAGLGIPLLAGGYATRNNAYKKYNQKCASATPISFNFTAGQNGLGIAMQF